MRRRLVWFLVGGLLGTGLGFAIGIFVFPYIFPPPAADQQVADRASHTTLATGTFIHADSSDPIHWGRGSVTLLQASGGDRIVYLEKDFEVGPGPDFRVYLVRHEAPRTKDDVRAGFRDLGGLMSFSGSQIYRIPADVDLAEYRSVVVWCRAFSQLISPATLAKGF